MNLDDLSASELAQIDAICLEYESRYRRGNAPDIATIVSEQGGRHAAQLRRELEAVRDELQSDATIGAATGAGHETGASVPEPVPPPGTRLGPYLIDRSIGRGGMGVVLAAIDERLGRRVAIKMLLADTAHQEELVQRFEREAKAVAAISHPNIVELFDVGTHHGLPYAVMEYLDGELLSDRLTRSKFTAAETRLIGEQIAAALAKAHDAGVIHRDLKPHNIMLLPGNSVPSDEEMGSPLVKLFDFGLSRAPHRLTTSESDRTQAGVILGTPGYMAPEQALGADATAAADIFALGCILFEAFYGKRAFEGDSQIKRHQATLSLHPKPDPIRRRDDIHLAELIDRCLAKDPGHRPSSAAAIAGQLRRASSAGESIGASAAAGESAGRFTRRRLLELTVGGSVGGLLAAYWMARRPDDLSGIRSLAVLSFTNATDAPPSDGALASFPPALGDRTLTAGEELAAMIAHELARIPTIQVRPFRRIFADTPEQFRQVAASLGVDALLDGSVGNEMIAGREFLRLDFRIVSAEGVELARDVIKTAAANDFLSQSRFAVQIAEMIGQNLTSTAETIGPPKSAAFHCLVDGKVRCDPDSVAGLKRALICFQRANQADKSFAGPFAGIALTSLALAAQSSDEESVPLTINARENTREALQLAPDSIDARLAQAMDNWQALERFSEAFADFRQLIIEAPNNWQVRHQFGLLQTASGHHEAAIESLNEASLLNPLSVTVQADLARAHWFAGDPQRAVEDAGRLRARSNNHPLAAGLLVDLFEDQGRYDDAARVYNSVISGPGDSYEQDRNQQRTRLPYGPFGDTLNQAIVNSRQGAGLDAYQFAGIADPPRPLMLPLLLAAHPSFAAVRHDERGKRILAELQIL